MKQLLLIVVLGVIAFLWHRQQVAKLSQDLLAAQAESKQALGELETLRTERNALQVERDGLRTERNSLRTERDALKAERDGLRVKQDVSKAPPRKKVPAATFDSSPMITSFFYKGIQLIEARIMSVNRAGVTVVDKFGRQVVVPLERAIKMPELRMKAAQAMQEASEQQ